MRKHSELLLKTICALLVALIVIQLARIVLAKDPLTEAVESESEGPPAAQAKQSSRTNTSRAVAKRGDVPPLVRTQVDAIVKSEIFGALPRPLPMALLGIAGRDALIRTPMGQTSLMRVNEEQGGVKLLQIGTNRVLIEHEGKKKELMLFAGYGGETLLPKEEKK
jgi:hypothetical protein